MPGSDKRALCHQKSPQGCTSVMLVSLRVPLPSSCKLSLCLLLHSQQGTGVLSNIRILQFLSKRVHSKGRQFIKQIIKMLTGTFKQIREKLSPFPFPWVEQLFALSVGHRYSQKSQSSGIFTVRGSDVCVFLFLESLVARATWRERQRTKRTRY